MKDFLKTNQRAQLEAAYQMATDKRTANRINLILLLDEGYSYEEVSAILRFDETTVRRQEKSFLALGLEEFLKNPFAGGVCKLTALQLEELESFLDLTLCETTAEIVEFVSRKFDVHYTNAGMSALLKRLGFIYKKPTIIPGKNDLSAQIDFIEYYEQIKSSMSEDDKLYFVDGVHPQYNSMPAHGWIRKGTEKQLKSNTGRDRININGALDPDSFEVIAKVDDTLDSKSTIQFFEEIEKANPSANKIVLILDNARYYYSAEVFEYVSQSKMLEMVFLPPYAPNLNLIERLWKFMKKKTVYNKYYASFKEFKNAIGEFFLNLPQYYDELSTIITEEFQLISAEA